MKYVTFSKSALAVTAGMIVFIACANQGDDPSAAEAEIATPATEPAPPETKLPAKTPPAATPPPTTTTPAEKKCAPSCTTDTDCADSCPAVAGGVECCDAETKTCFTSKTPSCPLPTAPADPDPDPAPAY